MTAACSHRPVPVHAVDGTLVARLCVDCDEQLPAKAPEPMLTPMQKLHRGLLDEFTRTHYDYTSDEMRATTYRRMPDGQIAAVSTPVSITEARWIG